MAHRLRALTDQGGLFRIHDGIRLTSRQFESQLTRFYDCSYTLGLMLFVGALAIGVLVIGHWPLAITERMDLPRLWIGWMERVLPGGTCFGSVLALIWAVHHSKFWRALQRMFCRQIATPDRYGGRYLVFIHLPGGANLWLTTGHSRWQACRHMPAVCRQS